MAEEYYDDEEYMDEEEGHEEDGTLSAALGAQMGQAPWYVSSVAIHCVIFLILLLIPVEQRVDNNRTVVISTEMIEEVEEEELEEPEPDIEEEEPEIVTDESVVVDTPVVKTTDVEISDHFETDDQMDDNTALGDPENISDVDSEFVGTPALMGVGASGGKGGGGRFGYRNGGGRKNAVRRGGGSRRTESAVDWALRWLAAHQEYDGHWDCAKYGGAGHDVAVTSLATLAFLGAGNSTRFGKYKDNVNRAAEWLKGQQGADGRIGPHRYEAGISLMAISELYGMSNTSDLKMAAQKAVDWAAKSQCPSGGWDYAPSAQRVDTSVTGWWVMGLKSAKVAGLHVPSEVMENARKYLQKATTANSGSVSYSCNAADVNAVKTGGGSIRLTAVSLTCLQFLGVDRTDVQVKGCADKAMGQMPDPNKFDFYLWYYDALGLFQMGIKSDYWKRFNPFMKDSLLSTQVKEGTFEQNKGSWNPEPDHHGSKWGRVGQTALGALMLEVYYRYKEVH